MDTLATALAPSRYESLLAADQVALDGIPGALCLCAADGTIMRFNRRAAELWGRIPPAADRDERFCGALRLWHLDGRPLRRDATPMAAALRTGVTQRDRELVIERPDGTRVVALVNVEPLLGPDGMVEGAVNCFQEIDISARKQADAMSGQLAAIIESSDDAIASKDLNGILVSWNKGAERLFGYTATEIVGKPVTILIPEDHQDEEPEILARIRRGERVEHYETVRRRKDGTLIDISLSVSPVRDAAGRIVGASKIARDISARKRAEEQRDLLIAELSHRVKNALATVISVAHLSFGRNPDVAEARRSFDARLRALAQTHGRLAEASWAGLPLDTIVNDELAPYRREDGANLRVAGPRISVTPKCALMLAMAVHELATNAAKYGALSVRGGTAAVTWHVDPRERQLRFSWAESGGPRVAPPARTGFGRLLLERAVASDLRGQVRLDSPPPASAAPSPCRSMPASHIEPEEGLPEEGPPEKGPRILVAEDEFLVAVVLEDSLRAAGYAPVGPFATLAFASEAAQRERFAAAVLDVNLNGEMVYPLADALAARGVPFVLLSGYGTASLPERFRAVPLLGKPHDPEALIRALRALLPA